MQENNTPSTNQPDKLTPEAQKKVIQWGNLGLIVHNTELKLQAQAQAIIAKLKIPKTIEEIPEAEAALKQVKSEYNILSTDRKNITTKLDGITTRLMNPEKSIIAAIPSVEQAIISMKKIDADNKAKLKAKEDELRRIREFIMNHINQMDINYKQKIADQVSKAYNYALGKGNISESDLPTYLDKCKDAKGFSAFDFTYDIPEIKKVYVTQDEVLVIWNELAVNIKEGSVYVEDYHTALKNQFEFYHIAIKNKEAALKLQKENADKAAADLAKEAEAKQTATKIEALAVTHNAPAVGTEIKALKTVWALDVEDSKENAVKIIAAFIGNMDLCEGGIRVKTWFNLSVEQMGSALVWLKNRDENFNCGIKFKKVDKL